MVVCVAALLCWFTARTLAADDAAGADEQTLLLRLRSFAAGASARLEIEPTPTGGRARLSAMHLPPPDRLAPNAHVYLVWATGGRILRLGELRRDAHGNAALEFAHPASFTRYSLIVTAERSAAADHPGGAPVFSTHADEVRAVYPAPVAPHSTESTAAHVPARPVVRPRYAAHNTRATDFYADIDTTLSTDANARDITMVGVRRPARRARGYARVTATEGTAYVRAHFRRVPPPARFGANRYVLWATTPEGVSHYLGSLPRQDLNSADTYLRAGGMNGDRRFDLLVTAERGRYVRGTRRVLATVRAQRVYQGRQRAHRRRSETR